MTRLCPRRAPRLNLAALCVLLLGILTVPRFGHAQGGAGRVVGRVSDAASGEALSGVAVQIPALKRGVNTSDDGRFVLDRLPAGTYTVRYSHIGFGTVTRDGVVVTAGADTKADAKLKREVLKGEEVNVSGKRPLVDIKSATSQRSLLAEDIENVALKSVADLVEKQTGVVVQDNEVHIRGGRGDEVVYITNGVRQKDVLTGRPVGSAVSPRAIQEINITSGGFESEYGDALSGVVQVSMKEGNPKRYTGYASYSTDHGPIAGGQAVDQMDVQFGGPEPITSRLLPALGIHLPGTTSFYVDLGSELTGGYLPSVQDLHNNAYLRSAYKDKVFGHEFSYGHFFAPREDNVWRFAMNGAWNFNGGDKIKFFTSKRLSINQGFGDAVIGDLSRLSTNYPWAYKNALDRYPTQLDDENTLSAAWTHAFSKFGYQELRVSRTFTAEQRDVMGKPWYAYGQGPFDDLARRYYFYPAGDSTSEGPDWLSRYSQETTGEYKLTRKWIHQRVDLGGNIAFQDAQWARIKCPCDSTKPALAYGSAYDFFHVYPTTGNLYLQNHFDFQGLSGNAGSGFMFWAPGALADRVVGDTTRTDIVESVRTAYFKNSTKLFGRQVRTRWTPRLAVAYPMSDHTKFFFNYGRYAQWPTYYYVYTRILPSRSGQFPQKGNPALNPELSVNYEVGAEHQFSRTMAFKVAVYNKDLYDYVTSRLIAGPPSYVQFYNQDYARSRGVELELRKRRTGYWSGVVSYAYSQANGKGSDPNEILIARESGATDFGEGQPREINLYWNRPNKVTLNFDVRIDQDQTAPRIFGVSLPRNFGANIYGVLQSGLAYTPEADCGRGNCAQTGADYSKNGPIEKRWDLRTDKTWRVSGARSLRLSMEIYNLFGAQTPRRIDPRTGQGYVLGVGTAAVDATNPVTIGRYTDPSYYQAPRSGRLGLEWSW